jgi:hypothetical protein
MNKQNIGIPNTFKAIMTSLVKEGHFVHIITGIPFIHGKSKLDKMGIIKNVHYTHFFSIEEHLLKHNKTIIGKDKKGRNRFDAYLWDTCKSIYCKGNDIDLMIDDSPVYGKYFSTPYALLIV